MPADEVNHRAEEDGARARSGARHAAPRKPLITRLHLPAGKVVAIAAMPTAVLMGLGFTPTLTAAQADDAPTAKNLTAEEFQNCVEVLDQSGKAGEDGQATPSPSESAGQDAGDSTDDGKDSGQGSGKDGSGSTGTAGSGGSDAGSGSGDTDGSQPSASPSPDSGDGSATEEPTASASPSPEASASENPGLLKSLGDAVGDLLGGGSAAETPAASASPSASATSGSGQTAKATDSATSSDSASPLLSGSTGSTSSDSSGALKDTVDKLTGTVGDTAEKAVGDVGKTVQDTTEKVGEAAESATPSPSASPGTDPEDCPAATDEEGGLEDIVALPNDPWYLDASSLTLKGADYQGVVKVKTANGTVKKVLKYVVSKGTDIGDLHQTVNDGDSGKTYHVQAAKGSTSTIRGGDTVMYTESISGKLFGLIPITFSPDFPPPLNIPLIYFTDVKVTQAGQFGGTLTVPGLHQFTSDYITPSSSGLLGAH